MRAHNSPSTVPPTLEILHLSIKLPGPEWFDQSVTSSLYQIRLCKITSHAQTSTSAEPLSLSCSLLVNEDRSWNVFIHGQAQEIRQHNFFSAVPDYLDCNTINDLLQALHLGTICPGHTDHRYHDMAKHRKGTFIGEDGRVRATLQSLHPVVYNGEVFSSTIRTTECELLTSDSICPKCKAFGVTLRSLYSRWSTRSDETSKYTNNKYLTYQRKTSKLCAHSSL